MKSPRAVIELLLAGCAAVACVLSWLAAGSEVTVAPVLEGEPMTTSMVYHPPLLTLSLLLATLAGVLIVLGVSRICKQRGIATYRASRAKHGDVGGHSAKTG
ncbi:MAG: hypothetical protein AB7G47_00560 [Mycolicibacterium sp.]|uniref:hypothetical protein n=1 Tax=Mycolicibacterium sp. TaxID=2320850 RepID=UPI003D1263CC